MSIERARSLRKRMSPAEARLWVALRQDPLSQLHFRRQVSLGPYYADFASHTAKLVIEVDGAQHYEDAALAYDETRLAFIASQGYRVLRVTVGDVLNNLAAVVEAILAVTPTHHAPHGAPSPQGGGSAD